MHITMDTVVTLTISITLAALSATAFTRTDAKLSAEKTAPPWHNALAQGGYQRGYEKRFEQSLPTYDGAVDLWAALRWGLLNEPASGAIAGRDGWLFTAEEFTAPKAPRDLPYELQRAAATLAANDITLLPIVIPDKARMQANRLPRGRSAAFSSRYDRVLEDITTAGLKAIDLRPVLAAADSFMRTDSHWSPQGAQRVAQLIAAQLPIVDLPKTEVQTQIKGEYPFDGDLLTFVNTGRFRPIVGPHPEPITSYETIVAETGGLFDEAQVPVVLVGTSFSAKPDFHFDGFLKQALQTDVLNLSRVGQGPFAPMDSYLTDLGTLTPPPSLVIWEIPERYLSARSIPR